MLTCREAAHLTRSPHGLKKEKGKDRQRTQIKDPWTKPKRGRIEGGAGWGGRKWWWESGDNCT